MSVHPDRQAEYEQRHAPIWADLQTVLLDAGVRTYSIYLDPQTSDLFGYVEVEDEARWHAVATTDACRRWWQFMRDVMPTDAGGRPIARDLREVFHLER
jgi:L-rhamnose mutarotase